jgi:hypothetical protein
MATGLSLSEPEKLQLRLYQTLAGPIPVLIAGNRQDFVSLLRALTKRNEPEPIPDSMGSCIISGYNNWHRVAKYKQKWQSDNPEHCSESEWSLEFQHLIPQKELYQDRLMLLSPGAYSNIPAHSLELTETEWLEISLKIRLEHEATHYITRRWFGSMQNNLYDELIADYRGIVAALGYYRADWFLYFLGLESFPNYRQGGRLENYRGNPPLSEGAFKILQELVKKAAENLEQFEREYCSLPRNFAEEVCLLLALTKLRLEELASPQAHFLLNKTSAEARSTHLA